MDIKMASGSWDGIGIIEISGWHWDPGMGSGSLGSQYGIGMITVGLGWQDRIGIIGIPGWGQEWDQDHWDSRMGIGIIGIAG